MSTGDAGPAIRFHSSTTCRPVIRNGPEINRLMAAAMREHRVVGSAEVDMFVPEDGAPEDLRIDDTAVPALVRREALRIPAAIRFEAVAERLQERRRHRSQRAAELLGMSRTTLWRKMR